MTKSEIRKRSLLSLEYKIIRICSFRISFVIRIYDFGFLLAPGYFAPGKRTGATFFIILELLNNLSCPPGLVPQPPGKG